MWRITLQFLLVISVLIQGAIADTPSKPQEVDFERLEERITKHSSREYHARILWNELNSTILEHTDNLSELRSQPLDNDASWEEFLDVQEDTQKLLSLRQSFYVNANANFVADLQGFGHLGRASLARETHIATSLALAKFRYITQQIWHDGSGLRLDEARIARLIVQLCFIAFLIFLWSSRCIPYLRSKAEREDRKNRASQSDFFWILLFARRPWELLIELKIAALLIDSHLSNLALNEVLMPVYWLIGNVGVGYLVFALGAVQYRRAKIQDPKKYLRQFSVLFIFCYLALIQAIDQVAQVLEIRHMTLQSWAEFIWWFGAITITITLSLIWKSHNFKTLSLKEFKGKRIAQWFIEQNRGFMKITTAVLLACYLSTLWFGRSILAVLSANATIRDILSLVFQFEVSRKGEFKRSSDRPELDDDVRAVLFEGPQDYIGVYDAIVEKLKNTVKAQPSTISLVYGQRGTGKSRTLREVLKRCNDEFSDIPTYYIDCPDDNFGSLVDELGKVMKLDGDSSMGIVAEIKDSDLKVIAIDNIHRLITPTIGGMAELERLLRLLRRSSDEITWIVGIDIASWRYVERARGERFKFDNELELAPWTEPQLRELIEATTSQHGYKLDFKRVDLPRQPDEFVERGEARQNASRYFRVLAQYARGNPGFAFTHFVNSLALSKRDNTFEVGRFDTSLTGQLDDVSIEQLLMLRAIIQLGWASKERIESATLAKSDEVTDALRRLTNWGVIQRLDNGYYQVTWSWYPEVIQMMQRKHLLQFHGDHSL